MKHDIFCERRTRWGAFDCCCASRAYEKDPLESAPSEFSQYCTAEAAMSQPITWADAMAGWFPKVYG